MTGKAPGSEPNNVRARTAAAAGGNSRSASKVGRYNLMGVIGAGSSGTVFLGVGPVGQRVAVKVLSGELQADTEFLARFRVEAAVMRRVDHPNCVRVVELIDDPPVAAIVSELVDGASLQAVLGRAGTLSGEQALGVLEGALEGLVHLHALGLVHGDVKPANILVGTDGISKLADFGLARPVHSQGRATRVEGTPAYLSPEQVRGDPADHRSDLYSCGAVLFEALTGQPVFSADSVGELRRMHRDAPPPDPRDLRPDLHPALGALVTKALAKQPGQRHQSAAELLGELRSAAASAYGADWATRAQVGGLAAGAAGAVAAALAATGPGAATAQLATLVPDVGGLEVSGAVTTDPPPPPPPTPGPLPPPAHLTPPGSREAPHRAAARSPRIVGGLIVAILIIGLAGVASAARIKPSAPRPVVGAYVTGVAKISGTITASGGCVGNGPISWTRNFGPEPVAYDPAARRFSAPHIGVTEQWAATLVCFPKLDPQVCRVFDFRGASANDPDFRGVGSVSITIDKAAEVVELSNDTPLPPPSDEQRACGGRLFWQIGKFTGKGGQFLNPACFEPSPSSTEPSTPPHPSAVSKKCQPVANRSYTVVLPYTTVGGCGISLGTEFQAASVNCSYSGSLTLTYKTFAVPRVPTSVHK